MPAAPRMPSFDPTKILQGIGDKVDANLLQIVLVVGICSLVVGYLIYLIWQEYQKHPLKFHRKRWGKSGFKLSDVLRKK